MMLPTAAAMTTRRSSFGGTLGAGMNASFRGGLQDCGLDPCDGAPPWREENGAKGRSGARKTPARPDFCGTIRETVSHGNQRMADLVISDLLIMVNGPLGGLLVVDPLNGPLRELGGAFQGQLFLDVLAVGLHRL